MTIKTINRIGTVIFFLSLIVAAALRDWYMLEGEIVTAFAVAALLHDES